MNGKNSHENVRISHYFIGNNKKTYCKIVRNSAIPVRISYFLMISYEMNMRKAAD